MQQLAFFTDSEPLVLSTEGIKYAGSKLKLIPHILQLARKVPAKTVLDAFSGTTRVSQAFAKNGYRVICNDLAVWSEVFGTCYLLNRKQPREYQELIDHLNSVSPVDGWFTYHYGGLSKNGSAIQHDGFKRPWQVHNTRKLDGIRQEIDRLGLNDLDKAVALTSLILALDEVDNTLGHFVSYLRQWSPRSYNDLFLQVPAIFAPRDEHSVFRHDVFDLMPRIVADLAYFDPPYGSNNDKMPPSRVRYASYYHIWKTVCLADEPEVFGKVNRRKDSRDRISASVFEEFRKDETGRHIAVDAIERLIKSANVQWIILSYSSGGRATAEELNDVVKRNGRVLDILKIEYKSNVMAGMKWTNEWLRDIERPNSEFLFLIEK